ncbi:MAG: repair protein SbcC/Rad50, partial [Micromonosporaceae bacterium]|nr:repair protein SbcC/Rad50 [Micromonosporaceae bacterium]
MRPLTLSLRGVRSYLTEEHIDFTAVGLAAIHGDTGAGKSSILEALCFALYGGPTWEKRSAAELIADGAHTMQVRLTFRSANKTWQVTRAISRSSSPPSRHELVCAEEGTRYDTKQEVNAVIEKMIGLSHTAFLKAVILPQGRFQALLHTSKDDRTTILKGILGIDQLDAMQIKARAYHDRLRPLLNQLILNRRGLLDDPPATAKEATLRRDDALHQQEQLTEARTTVREAVARRIELISRASSAEQHARRLTELRRPDAAAEVRTLADLDQAIRSDQEDAKASITQWERQQGQLQDAVDAAEQDGRGPSTLPKAIAVVEATRSQLPDIDSERERIQAETEKLANDLAQADQQAATVAQLADQATEAERLSKEAADAVDDARELVAGQRSAIGAARTQRATLRRAEADLTDAQRRLTDANTAIETTTGRAQTAHANQTAAQDALDAVIRANAAAHAAATCHPGDPCPICTRDLPDTFQTPHAPKEKDARQALAAADRLTADADRAHQTAVTARKHTSEETERIQERVDDGRKDVDQALVQLVPHLGDIDLDKSDTSLLTPLTVWLTSFEKDLETALLKANEARQRATASTTALKHRRQALTDRQVTLTADRRRLGQRVQQTVEAMQKLPTVWRLEPLTLDNLNALLNTARRWEQNLSETTGQLRTVREQLKESRDRREMLGNRHLAEVERPARQLLKALDALSHHAGEAAASLGEQPPFSRPGDDEFHQLARWAATLDDTVGALLRSADDHAKTAMSEAARATEQIAEAMRDADVDNPDQLEDLIIRVAAAAEVAQADLDRAERETPVA